MTQLKGSLNFAVIYVLYLTIVRDTVWVQEQSSLVSEQAICIVWIDKDNNTSVLN